MMTVPASLFIFFLFSGPVLESEEAPRIIALVEKARASYSAGYRAREGGNTKAAVVFFEEALSSYHALHKNHSITNGALFYNIGTLYQELGRDEHAKLYYQATRFYQGVDDAAILHNIEIMEKAEPLSQEKASPWSDIFFWHDWPLIFQVEAGMIFLGLAFVFFGVSRWWRRRPLHILSTVFLLIVCTLGASIAFNKSPSAIGIVDAGAGAVAHELYGESYPKSFPGDSILPYGTRFHVIGQHKAWLNILLPAEGITTWLKKEETQIVALGIFSFSA